MAIVVELTFRINDLLQNESYELLRHSHDPIHMENFILDSHHLSFFKNKARYINSSRQYN
jgi:hypothetical protein